MFNKMTDWTKEDWLYSEANKVMSDIPKKIIYIQFQDMTDEEKAAHPEAKTTGGYLKEIVNISMVNDWWKGLNKTEKNVVMSIPNFDKDVFKETTGIDVE